MSLSNGPVEPTEVVEIKSQFELEFRRISVPRTEAERLTLDSFYRLVTDAHCLPRGAPVLISYQSSRDMRQTPLESAEELATALQIAAPLLRLYVSRLRGLEVEVSGSEEELGEDEDEKGRTKKGGEVGGGRGKGRSPGGTKGEREKSPTEGRHRERQQNGMSNLFQKAVNSILRPSLTQNQSLSNACIPPHSRIHEETYDNRTQPQCWEEGEGGDGGKEGALSYRTKENGVVNGLNKLSLSTEKIQQEFPFVIEIYGFSPSLSTQDLLQEFDHGRSEFCVKWVDDTHALGIFASEKQAWLSAGGVYRKIKTRMLRDGTEQSISTAENYASELRPPGGDGEGRPKTTAMVARRMVSSALGIRVPLSTQQKEKENRELEAAREQRRSRH